MQGLFQPQAMAMAELAIRVRYVGRLFEYASFYCNSSGSGTLTVQLGVSNTSLADAVSNDETVFLSSDTNDRMDDIVNCIRWWKVATASHEVKSGDFECDLLHCIASETPHHATVDKFEDDDGLTNNLVATWHEVLKWDNNTNACGWVSRRIPHPGISKAGCVIDSITGELTNGGSEMGAHMYRYIYDDDGTALYSSAITANVGEADFNILAGTRGAPWAFKGPVIVRDSNAAPTASGAQATETDAVIMWDVARMPL